MNLVRSSRSHAANLLNCLQLLNLTDVYHEIRLISVQISKDFLRCHKPFLLSMIAQDSSCKHVHAASASSLFSVQPLTAGVVLKVPQYVTNLIDII